MEKLIEQIEKVKAEIDFDADRLPIALYRICGKEFLFVGVESISPIADSFLEHIKKLFRKMLPEKCEIVVMQLHPKFR